MDTAAVVARLAPESMVRFGSFELLASRGDLERLRALADWVIARHYPHLVCGVCVCVLVGGLVVHARYVPRLQLALLPTSVLRALGLVL